MEQAKFSGRKIGLMSDMHGNYPAFRACFDDALQRGADSFLFLGDYVSDLAQPQETLDLLYEIRNTFPAVCLRGNRERYMLEREMGHCNFSQGSKSGSLLFTYEHLRKKDLDFFRGLKISDTIEINGISLEISHASMENDRYYFDHTDGNAACIFPQMKSNYLLTGHSHHQFILRDGNRTIINPGSVGIPHCGKPLAQYALLDLHDGTISWQLRDVTYDVASVIHAQFALGLVDYAKYWAIGVLYDIITGEEWVLNLLNHVQAAGDVTNEDSWRSVAAGLGMKETEEEILEFFRNRL